MKWSYYREPSLRDRIHRLNSLPECEEFAQTVNRAVQMGKLSLSPSTVKKMNAALTARRKALQKAVLYGPDGRPLVL